MGILLRGLIDLDEDGVLIWDLYIMDNNIYTESIAACYRTHTQVEDSGKPKRYIEWQSK